MINLVENKEIENSIIRRRVFGTISPGLLPALPIFPEHAVLINLFRGLPEAVSILSGLGGLGTLILAYLYFRQQRILKEQIESEHEKSEIMRQQREIQESSHLPIIRVLNWEIVKQRLVVSLENVGNGQAVNLHMISRLWIIVDDRPVEVDEYFDDDQRDIIINGDRTNLYLLDEEDEIAREGGVLGPNDKSTFFGTPGFELVFDLPDQYAVRSGTSIGSTMLKISEEGFTEAVLLVDVGFRDLLGNEYQERILCRRFDFSQHTNLQQVVEEGELGELYLATENLLSRIDDFESESTDNG